MNNQSYRPLNPEEGRNSIAPFVPHQNFLGYEEATEAWDYQEFLGLLQRRALLIIGVAATVMTGVYINLILNPKPSEYESSFQMLAEPVAYDTNIVDIASQSNPLTKPSLDYESQILILRSPELLQNSIKQLQSAYPDIDYNSLINSLRIVRLNETKILQVSYRSQNPVESKEVLEQIAKDYLEYSLEKRQTKIRQGLQYINRELPSLQKRVDQVQRELQIFQQRYNFHSPESLASQIAQQTANLIQEQQTLEVELVQARANSAFLQSEDGKKAVLDSYPVYQELNNELRQLDIQILSSSTLFREENPSIITLREKRNALLPLIQQESERYILTKQTEAASALNSLELNNQELRKNQQILEQQRQQLPNLIRQYTEIQRRLQIATESLNRFLSSRENLQIENSQTEIGWQLIQLPYQPTLPVVSSSIVRNLILGFAGSIVLAIGAALLIDKMDHTYQNAWSLKERIQLPVLANIPFNNQLAIIEPEAISQQNAIIESDDLLPTTITKASTVSPLDYSYNYTNFAEAVRMLYTNIHLLNADSQIRSITITSAMPGEGKSTIAFHLAQIATAMGQRVLLVDADMRRPSIHTLSNLNNLWGLSSLITSNLPIQKVVRQLPSMNDLSIITAGPLPPDCAKLLSSEKMKRLMADFHSAFDLVIYDVPPLVGIADANLIASQTDGLLMVARINQTDRSVFERAIADLKMTPINLLGVVANGQKHNLKSYYSYEPT
ncbi:polysaccharide biosynthesis tyrosine autokinase [Nodularia sp. UHCC 0506]|uniref:GumC family protein n=1 Tax=Nodularia sp. UHCC 0506 TaxID=3110243 RepID=UPI002B1F0C07|nr:polysaccharide biosynthesis tyrosine autokinase [Nodularia sp. UHCC 0506]MEA5516172.1 polysaccharide biosynthesis tyrosine autokinase [Nodularia sp. UHCC 0506]